jgi:hypothetical protein
VLKFHYLQKTFLGGIMMDRIISFCGLICTDCEAYQATQVKDHDWLERVAAGWREEYKNPAFTAENVACDGCLGVEGQHCSHCFECSIRSCGMARGVANCGECPDYESCSRIQDFFKFVPSAKLVLDEVHTRLL